jgi:NAD(P)-dependent dehydrogenase (short-subunit alcohol dehydrogenase family)
VTGAGRGVGRAVAQAFAAEGARLVLADLGCDLEGRGSDPEVITTAAREIRDAGADVVSSTADVGVRGQAAGLVELALERFGRLDVAVSMAGVVRDRTILNMEDDDLDRLLDVHVRGTFELTRAAARAMVDGGRGGAIVLATSPVAFFGAARQSGAAATSAAVVGLVRSAAAELRRHAIRVNAIAPTARTRATAHRPTLDGARGVSMSPEHVAPVAVFLATDLGAEVQGEVVGVAGGRIYSFRGRETTGAFVEGDLFTPEQIRDAWSEIARG